MFFTFTVWFCVVLVYCFYTDFESEFHYFNRTPVHVPFVVF